MANPEAVAEFYKRIGETPVAETTNTGGGAEFLQRIGAGPEGQLGQTVEAASPLPQTQAQVLGAEAGLFDSVSARMEGLPQARAEADYMTRTQVPGVPLDVSSGAEWLTRAKLGIHRSKEEQLGVLRGIHGADKIRLDEDGNFIVRMTDATGKPKDLLVDERKMTARDYLDVLSEAPALGLTFLTTKGIPAGQILRTAVTGAASYFAGGAVTDAAVRAADDMPIDPGEILSARGFEGIVNAGLGYPLGKAVQLGSGMMRLSKAATSNLADDAQGAAMREIDEARGRVRARTGVTMEPSVAEFTGSPLAIRLENFLSNIPFARNTILKKWARQVENEMAVQKALGAAEVPDVGQRVIAQLQRRTQGVDEAAGAATDVVQRETQGALADPLAAIPGKKLSPHQFGSRMKERGEAQLESFKGRARELYDNVRALPEANAPVFDAAPIQARAKALTDELVKTAEGDVAKALSPTGITPVLEQVNALPAQQSYFDLVKLRDMVYDKLGADQPISSRGERILKDLGASITRAMQEQGPRVMGPRKWATVQEANTFYRENVEKFYQKGVVGMFKPRTEAGFIDPERVASQLLAGGKGSVETYKTLTEFFEKPQAIKDMNRMLRDKVLEGGTDTGTGLIKLEDLTSAVDKLEPEIVQALFGRPKDTLLKQVQLGQTAMRQGTKGFKVPERGTQAAVEADALQKALDEGTLNVGSIQTMVDATRQARAQYQNAIFKAVRENDAGTIAASPDTFAQDYLFNPGTKLGDVKQAMRVVTDAGDVQLVEDVRRAYLAQIFKDSARISKAAPREIIAIAKGSPLREVDPQKLALRVQADAARMEEVLGRDSFEGLRDFAVSIGARSQRDLAGALVGAEAGSGLIHRLVKGLGGLPELAQYKLLSYAMTSPRTIRLMRTLGKSDVDLSRLMKALALSPEVMNAVTADSASPEEAAQVATDLKAWGEPFKQTPTTF